MQLKVSKYDLYTDCFEGVMASAALYLNRRYEWMYLNEWRFRFELPPAGTRYRLGTALNLYRDKVGPLKEFHGIHYRQYPCEDLAILRNVLETKLAERMPITVRVDSYYCPWDKSFKKYHNANHIFMINGLENKTGNLICSDPFYHSWDKLVSIDEFALLYTGQYGVFEITEDISSATDGVNTFQKMLRSLYDEGAFEAIRNLAEEVGSANFAQEINTDTDVWFAPVYRRMIEIANCRGRLNKLITYVAQQYDHPELLRPLPLLEIIGEGWRQAKDLTLKLLITGNQIFQNRLACKIKNIADTEDKAAETLLSI